MGLALAGLGLLISLSPVAYNEDGTFTFQPNRDNNPGDFTRHARLSASATVALIFSLREGALRMTGAR